MTGQNPGIIVTCLNWSEPDYNVYNGGGYGIDFILRSYKCFLIVVGVKSGGLGWLLLESIVSNVAVRIIKPSDSVIV